MKRNVVLFEVNVPIDNVQGGFSDVYVSVRAERNDSGGMRIEFVGTSTDTMRRVLNWDDLYNSCLELAGWHLESKSNAKPLEKFVLSPQ